MEKFCVPGSVLWDVGAFVGYVTAHFAQSRFGLAAIHSFEPNPQNLVRLKALFENNSRVTIHPFALGRAEDTLELSFSPQSAAMGSLVRESKGGQRVSVRVRAGDGVRNELKTPPDVIKIDVEGFEPEVLAGLSHTILEKRPTIFFEHIFLSDVQIEQLIPQNYRLFFINDDGNFSEGIASRVKGHDAFLVPAEKLAVVEALMAHNCCCPPLA
jgi:FkbM family methyltransferase